jgi:hypothetical protein
MSTVRYCTMSRSREYIAGRSPIMFCYWRASQGSGERQQYHVCQHDVAIGIGDGMPHWHDHIRQLARQAARAIGNLPLCTPSRRTQRVAVMSSNWAPGFDRLISLLVKHRSALQPFFFGTLNAFR